MPYQSQGSTQTNEKTAVDTVEEANAKAHAAAGGTKHESNRLLDVMA